MTAPVFEQQYQRSEQDDRWGVQHLSWVEWMSVLTEEVGELAMAVNHLTWPDSAPESPMMPAVPSHRHRVARHEATHVAAVAVAIIEHLTERLEAMDKRQEGDDE